MHSTITALEDRLLLADGTSVVDPEQVVDFLMRGVPVQSLMVTEETADVKAFNLRSDIVLKVFTENIQCNLDFTWLIPKAYQELDLVDYFVQKLPIDYEEGARRVDEELSLVTYYQFEMPLRVIIYVIDVLKEKKIVWGVGRGSSCASYLLYLIGVHCVDPIKYEIEPTEFFHD